MTQCNAMSNSFPGDKIHLTTLSDLPFAVNVVVMEMFTDTPLTRKQLQADNWIMSTVTQKVRNIGDNCLSLALLANEWVRTLQYHHWSTLGHELFILPWPIGSGSLIIKVECPLNVEAHLDKLHPNQCGTLARYYLKGQ